MAMTAFFPLALVLAMPASAAGIDQSSSLLIDDERDIARAVELRVEKKYDAAIELLKKVAARSGGNPDTRVEAGFQEGLVLEEAGRAQEALEAYGAAVQDAPGATSAPYALMGWCRLKAKTGGYEDAIDGYSRILRTYPRFGSEAVLARAGVEEKAGRVLAATASCRIILRNYPQSAEAREAKRILESECTILLRSSSTATIFEELQARGECLMDQGKYAEARKLYESAQLGKQSPEIKADLLIATAVAYEAEGKFVAAERAYRSAAKAVPGTARAAGARMSIVQIYLDKNQLREAVKELTRVAKDFPGTGQAAQAQFMAGSTYETLGDRKKAEEAYRNVVEIAPQSPWAFESQQALVRLMERTR